MKDYTSFIAKGLDQYGWEVSDPIWNTETKESALVSAANPYVSHVTLARGRNFSGRGRIYREWIHYRVYENGLAKADINTNN